MIEDILFLSHITYAIYSFFLDYAVDVLVSELNFGTTKRWINAGSFVPYPSGGICE